MINTIAGKGGATPADYTTYHNKPVNGINYYKLENISVNGIAGEPRFATVEFNRQAEALEIYPNPSADKITLKSDEPIGTSEVELTDVFGKQYPMEITPVNAREAVLSLSGLSRGTYFIKFCAGYNAFVVKKIRLIKTILTKDIRS